MISKIRYPRYDVADTISKILREDENIVPKIFQDPGYWILGTLYHIYFRDLGTCLFYSA